MLSVVSAEAGLSVGRAGGAGWPGQQGVSTATLRGWGALWWCPSPDRETLYPSEQARGGWPCGKDGQRESGVSGSWLRMSWKQRLTEWARLSPRSASVREASCPPIRLLLHRLLPHADRPPLFPCSFLGLCQPVPTCWREMTADEEQP